MTARRTLIFLTVLAASQVRAECLPAGRATFAAGLQALNSGDLDTARARFEELVNEQPNCMEARNNLAVVLFEMGRPEEADAQLRQAVELDPDYRRARSNLRRVEGSFQGKETTPEIETALTGEATAAPTDEPTPAPTIPLPSTTPRVPAAPPTPRVPSTAAAPVNLAALEPLGASACVVDAAQKQLCVYRRAESGIVQDGCYPIIGTQVSAWPQWLVESDLTAQRVRLVDDTLHRKLRIIPDNVERDDSVRLRQSDYESLAKKITPWRTGFVVLAPNASVLSAAAATQAAQQVRAALERWRQGWEGKQLDVYTGFYGPSFVPQPERDVARWRSRQQALFERSGTIAVTLTPPSIFVLGDGSSVVTVFEQSYASGGAESRDVKALRWERRGDRWLINAETMLGGTGQPPQAHRRRGG